MANWIKTREVDSDSNAYDRYWDPVNGAAIVYRNERQLHGFANGVGFACPVPPEGNVQQLRIRPEAGAWWVYAWTDPRDGERIDYKIAVLTI